jgi:serine/threonine protein phosphatase PrpC
VRTTEGRRTCHVANLGDTRAVLCSEKLIARRVSIDHKVSNPSEEDRIRSEGGTIIKGRVAGQLAITRALGDLDLKPYVLLRPPRE